MLVSTIVYIVTLAVAFIFAAIYFIHMFQLESYLKPQYLKWVTSNSASKIIGRGLLIIASEVILIINANIITLAVCSVLNLLTAYFYRPKKAKKPLVFTTRVKRLIATSVIVFGLLTAICIVFGFIFLLPVIFILTAYIVFLAAVINTPVENAVRNWYINDAKRIIKSRKHNLTVIGITGSYGKTSTKFYLAKLLAKKYNVLMTPASYNTTMGVVKVVREMLKPSHEIFICEMGARNTGEIKEICDIVLPDLGIITSIGPQHLETFKSIENVIKTKFELADAVPSDGFVVLNGDNDYIIGNKTEKSVVNYGIDNKNTDFYADNIKCTASGTSFTLNYEGNTAELSTRLLGTHTVLNILACAAMSIKLGVDIQDIKTAVRMLESVPHRLEIIDGGDVVIIDDAFNSNPSGAKFALDVLSNFDGLKVLVTPGMVELGEKQYELNKIFGSQAAEVCDYIYVVGKVNYDSISSGAFEKGYGENKLINVSSPEQAVNAVRGMLHDKPKFVLLENDLPDNFK